jgi:hypothetical protein
MLTRMVDQPDLDNTPSSFHFHVYISFRIVRSKHASIDPTRNQMTEAST